MTECIICEQSKHRLLVYGRESLDQVFFTARIKSVSAIFDAARLLLLHVAEFLLFARHFRNSHSYCLSPV